MISVMLYAVPPMLISPDDVAWLVAIIRRLDARLSDAMTVLTEWGNVDKATAMAQRAALAPALVQADAALLELERAHHGLVGCDPTCEELIHPAVAAARQRQGTEGRG